MTVAVAGAGGHFGRAAADELLRRVDPSEIVLVTRDPSKLEEYAAKGVSVRHGDFDDAASLRDAFVGVDHLLVISTDALGRRIEQHKRAFDTAKEVGVRHGAYTSIVNPVPDNPAAVVPEHRGSEDALASSGLEWTFLRCGIYADYQIGGLQAAIGSGTHVHNSGDGKIAYVARNDLARAAAAVVSGEGHAGKAYELTGPELQSQADLAAVAADVSGKPIQAVAVDDEAFAAGLVEHAGMPPDVATFLATFGRAVREGKFAVQTSTIEELTGQAPVSVRDLLVAAG